MQKKFVELTTAFLAEAGIDCPVVPGENIVTVPLGDFRFYIALFENRSAVIMQGTVGVLPTDGREAFYAELLRMNSLFKGTNGATLGIEDDAVTLQSIIHITNINNEQFTVQAVMFLEALAAMLEQFGTIAERAVSTTSDTVNDADILAMQNMIRI